MLSIFRTTYLYHVFHLKRVPGMEVGVRKEEGGKDEEALMCYVPNVLPEKIANTKMESKSSGKSFIMRDVLGKAVERVQYFLNNHLTALLDNGKVIDLKGSVIVRNKLELEIELVYIQGHPLSKGKCPLNRECLRVFNNQQTKKTICFPLPRNLL